MPVCAPSASPTCWLLALFSQGRADCDKLSSIHPPKELFGFDNTTRQGTVEKTLCTAAVGTVSFDTLLCDELIVSAVCSHPVDTRDRRAFEVRHFQTRYCSDQPFSTATISANAIHLDS